MDGPAGGTRPEGWSRRYSPVRFFHGVLFVLGGGLTLFWSRWGLILVVAWAVIGLARLKARASTLDMSQERLRLGHLRDELTFLKEAAEHPDGTVDEQLRALEVLHRLGGISGADYETRRAQIAGTPPSPPAERDGAG